MADAHKALGNEAFKAQKFDEAIEHFTNAIGADPQAHVLYSNRSAAYASLNRFDEALADAEKCIGLNGAWGKGYSRKGAALEGLGRLEEAIAAYEQGLAQEPENAALKQGLAVAKDKADAGALGGAGQIGNMFADPALFGKIAGNPQTAAFLNMPDFVTKLQELQRNPSSIDRHLQDPRIMQVLGMLMGVNVSMGGAGEAFGEDARAPPPKPQEPEPEPEPMEEELTDEEKAARETKRQADAHKEQGNAAYKAKKFDEAIEHYTKAGEMMPEEMTYITNLAAVYFEQREYQKSVDTCKKAIEVGRANRADYKNVAKAYARMGNAYVKLEELESAIKAYEDSMLENRTEDVYKRHKDAVKVLKERQDKAYISEELSLKAREKGNELFKEGKYPEAIEAYTEVRAPSRARARAAHRGRGARRVRGGYGRLALRRRCRASAHG